MMNFTVDLTSPSTKDSSDQEVASVSSMDEILALLNDDEPPKKKKKARPMEQKIKPVPNKTSGFRGVSWCSSRQRWKAGVQVNNKKIYIGSHLTAEDAARAYNARIKHMAEQENDGGLKNKLLSNLYDVPNTKTKAPTDYTIPVRASRERKIDTITTTNTITTANVETTATTNMEDQNELEALLANFSDSPLPLLESNLDDQNDWFQAPPKTENMILFHYNSEEHLDLPENAFGLGDSSKTESPRARSALSNN